MIEYVLGGIMKSLVIISSLFLCFGANAVESLRPGLWETDFKLKSKSGKVEMAMEAMKTQLANMPPAQQQMIRESMAKHGMSFAGQPNRIKYCLSKEQAQKIELPKFREDSCTQEVTKKTATSGKIKIDCKEGISGTGEYTLNGPTNYTMKSILNTKIEGVSDEMTIDQSGKWLSANCENLKPQ
jgi:uncharacterized protein YneF (UPF0154 family)